MKKEDNSKISKLAGVSITGHITTGSIETRTNNR
jgi:hypothetical protein